MYKVLLVDDEGIFIEYLKNVIEWEVYDCQICGFAMDGIEAISQIKAQNPDIVFMDINMDKVNGLEVCDRVKNFENAPHIVILTAHSEFNFAHKAIKLGVFDYLLKPFDKIELLSALNKCIDNIKKNSEHQMLQQDKNKEEIEDLLRRIIEFGEGKTSIYSFKIENAISFIVTMIKFESGYDIFNNEIESQINKYNFNSDKIGSYVVGIYNGMLTIVHIIYSDSMELQELKESYCNLLDANKNYECVSIGSCVKSLTELNRSYQQAVIGIENRSRFRKNIIVFYDIEELDSRKEFYTPNDINILIKCFAAGQYEQADIIIEKIFELSENKILSFQYVVATYYSLITSIYSYYKHTEYRMTEHMSTQGQILSELNTCNTKQEIIEIIKNYIHEIFSDCMNFHVSEKNSVLVEKVSKYIEKHYVEANLSVNQIAQALFFESSYIRRIYKTQTGRTIMQQLEDIRINKAKDLLTSTNLKLSEVAQLTGFSDQFYFSRRFKLFTNIKPTEYRSMYTIL